ncbi:MAG: FAD-binding oxidoreductase [Bernardetiaceae bacterium]|jgi:glycine/D-amino acid oxidase-like deaminating enzyme|nr:FAD-binding oxidoreductase [Bernardetiaceae bacterium]
MLSFWEKRAFTEYDFAVVGGGIVGLSTVAALLERQPQARVLLLERGLLPTGASTKNAGFACFGSLTELLADLRTTSVAQMTDLVEQRWRGLHRLRERLGDAPIGYEPLGGYEVLTERELPALARLDEVNQYLWPIFGQPVFAVKNELLPTFGFAPSLAKSLVYNHLEGQIDTGAMMARLWAYVQHLGARLLTGCQVEALEPSGLGVRLRVRGPLGEAVGFQAGRVAVCTNAFTHQLVPGLDMAPGRGQVLVTEPLARLPFKGAFHYDEGYYYFRNLGPDRVLLGGGRHLDRAGETTTELATTPLIMNTLEDLLRTLILPGQPVAVAHRWAGIMAFGATKAPIVQPWAALPQVVLGVRMGGMGVALGSLTGEQVAGWLAS